MKRIASIILTLAMVLSLYACGTTTQPQQPAETPSAQPAETPASTAPAASAAETPAAEEPEITKDAIMAIYKAVLCDEIKLVVGKEDIEGFTQGETMLLSELAQKCADYITAEWNGTYDCCIRYGYLDCGSDGIPELALELVISDEEDMDDHIRYFVINCQDDVPTVVGDYEYYYRNYTSINEAGYIDCGGSSGAASYYAEYRILDAAGDESFVYSCSTEMANPKPAIPSYFLPKEIDDDYYDMFAYDEVENYYTVEAYNFEDFAVPEDSAQYDEVYDQYCRSYFFTITDDFGEDVAPAEEYTSLYEENGIKIVSIAEAEKMLQERREEMGVTEDVICANYIEYQQLDVAKLNDEVVENEDGSITVGCTANLIDNIRDGATIYLKPGVYNLTDWINDYYEEYSYNDYTRCRPYSYANCYNSHIFMDGYQVIVSRVNNLTLASLEPDDPAQIVTDNEFALVMSFCECSDLSLRNIVAGHTPGNEGHCSADVFEFNECDRVVVDNCDFYGCGCYGIIASDTAGLDVIGGRIHDCTTGMVELYSTYPVTFNGVTFENCTNEWCNMFEMMESSADFTECSFKNLGELFTLDASNVWMYNCTLDEAARQSVMNSEYYDNALYFSEY